MNSQPSRAAPAPPNPPAHPRIRYVNGERLVRIVAAGATWVAMRREELNRINVFPVPDGDTGTNMSLTFRAAAEGLSNIEDRSLPNVVRRISQACILGARGNSGMILSHFFLCLSEQIGVRLKLRAAELGKILGNSADALYSAIENPVEGTMLTVIRESMKYAEEVGQQNEDIQTLFELTLERARESLARTPELLPVLKRAGVVDSGAQGFVYFLEGILRYIHGDPVVMTHGHGAAHVDSHPSLEAGEIEYQYCTEVVMELPEPLSRAELKRIFHPFGDSLIALTFAKLAKVHVHTNFPDQVFGQAARLGKITHQKVDDMKLQNMKVLSELSAHQVEGGHLAKRTRKGLVAVVTDSTADYPPRFLAEQGVTVVPLHVRFGSESYRDQFEISPEQFFEKLVSSPHHPTTSQPAQQDLLDTYEKLATEMGTRDILSIHIGSALSGTFTAAQTAAKRLENLNIRVFDSGTATVGVGMLALKAAEMARAGRKLDEIWAALEKTRQRSGIIFTVDTLEYLQKGGRITWAAAFLGELLKFKPILMVADGKIGVKTKVRGREALLPKVLDMLGGLLPTSEPVRFCVVHSRRPEMMSVLSPLLKQRYRVAGIDCQSIGSVIGAHVGPGAWGVAWQVE